MEMLYEVCGLGTNRRPDETHTFSRLATFEGF